MRRVVIVGLGLIGGSLGLALKRNPEIHVTGVDSSPLHWRKHTAVELLIQLIID